MGGGTDRYLDVVPEVADTLAAGGAVVALESTVIAQGLPRPHNREAAAEMEAAVRAGGAVPATIAILDGRIRVGLTAAQLDRLADSPVPKASRRDLAPLLAAGGDGATTVSATMACAHLAGIRVFATGGIGGVHRGAGRTFDISADLSELARTPVAVVSAGAKSILDLPRTREVLETLGVPVVGYGTDTLPAFYLRDSGLAVDARADSPVAAAAILRAQWDLGLGGVLVANPIPAADALDPGPVEAAIDGAVAAAASAGVDGKALTPFLLARLAAATGGATLAANRALLRHNAAVAAAIAAALAEMRA
ncbi:MAG: pseudouridine-5'-phosphate glycosidase [Hyphomicrobiales bacterium]|nr:pseudouridine-5'-phosphate glycosidase [Hyphomicrobiales bacterium]